jgi:hypothetical protein
MIIDRDYDAEKSDYCELVVELVQGECSHNDRWESRKSLI